MELRSSHRQKENEYKELQITLSGLGFYEEGMELQEMRQIVDVLQQSVSETDGNFIDIDMERAIRESEMDFMPLNNERVFNSTMSVGTSPCTSPEIPSQCIIVHADVHHPLDWSPLYTEEERLRRKRLAPKSPIRGDHNNNLQRQRLYSYNEITETKDSKSPCSPCDSSHILFNKTEEIASSSIHTVDENNNNSFHEVVGPISMRQPPNDSGVNVGSQIIDTSSSMSQISTISISSSSSPTSSATSSSSSSSISSSASIRSANSVIEIVGPVSLRRAANDSGVNSFNENSNISSSSSWDFRMSSRSLEISDNAVEGSYHSLNLNGENSIPQEEKPGCSNGFAWKNKSINESSLTPFHVNQFNDNEDFENSEPSL